MSAFLCTDLHTAVCAIALSTLSTSKKSPTTLYRELRAMNSYALTCRYGDKRANATAPKKALNEAEFYIIHSGANVAPMYLSLLNSMLYQCSEGDALETHKVSLILQGVILGLEEAGTVPSCTWSI